MYKSFSKYLLASVLFASALISPIATAQEGSVITEDNQVEAWLVRCVTQGDAARACAMLARAADPINQRDLALIRLVRVLPEEALNDEEFAMQITLPTNINVRAGVDIVVDGAVVENVTYEVCTQRNCVSTFPALEPLLAALSLGFAAELTITDAGGAKVNASMDLNGFARALELL